MTARLSILSAALCAALAGAQERVTVLRGARVLPVSGPAIESGVVVIAGGKVQVVGGADTAVPDGATVVDCSGTVITPGLVDAGTVLGVRPTDLNEQGDEITPQVHILDAIDPEDPRFEQALRSGVTTAQVSPGNRNVIGGLGAVVKTHGLTVRDMLVRDESGLRLTMGGEPSDGNRAIRGDTPNSMYYRRPTTRMGVVWEARKAFFDAQAYLEQKTVPDAPPENGTTDPGLEVLVRALRGDLVVRTTARQEQDIRAALRLADEFGYVTQIDEATEAWRVVDELVEREVPVLFAAPSRERGVDGAEVRYHTLRLLADRGVPVAICTGASAGALDLVHEAMFAVRYGLSAEAALQAVTATPARLLGVDDRVGTLAPGKDADLVLWSGDPFDPSTAVVAVFVAGTRVHP